MRVWVLSAALLLTLIVNGQNALLLNATDSVSTLSAPPTKRIWFTFSSSSLTPQNLQSISVRARFSVGKSASDPTLMAYKTLLGGAFYYFDIDTHINGFKVCVQSDAGLSYETDWAYDLKPCYLYEIIADVSTKIRFRNFDLNWERHPDSPMLSILLEPFCSYSPSYENGYGAAKDLDSLVLKYYAGNVESQSWDNNFVADYSYEQVVNSSWDEPKSRLISVREKITELRESFNNGTPADPRFYKTSQVVGAVTLVLAVVLTTGGFLGFMLIKRARRSK